MQQQHDWRTGWTDLKVKRFYPICFDAMDGDPRHTSVLVRLVSYRLLLCSRDLLPFRKGSSATQVFVAL